MHSRLLFPVFVFLLVGIVGVFCTESHQDEAAVGMFEPMPEKSDTFLVTFRDTNYWIEGDSLFCVTGLMDNKGANWQKIWVRIDLKDEAGKPVEIEGKKELVLRAFSEAIPPFGASSFFYTIPLDQLSARPKDCNFTGAAALNVSEGPILVGGMQSNVKAFSGVDTTSDLNVRKETAWLITSEITNPLPNPSNHPRLNVLVYGRDQKLWFSQVLNPEDTLAKLVVMQPPPPVASGSTVNAFFQVTYNSLPKILEEVRIGRIDVLFFDAREASAQPETSQENMQGGQ